MPVKSVRKIYKKKKNVIEHFVLILKYTRNVSYTDNVLITPPTRVRFVIKTRVNAIFCQ